MSNGLLLSRSSGLQKAEKWPVNCQRLNHRSLRYQAVIYIFFPGYGLKKKWKDGRMTEITGRVFPFTSYEQSEAEGIKESYKGPLCFPGRFLSRDKRELWISGGHFCSSDNLRTRCFQAKSDFEKLAMLLEICHFSDRYCLGMIGQGNTNLYSMTKWMKTH